MHQPLEGIRILEWGNYHAGPGCDGILSDLGAEVIKIEQPGTGDPMRLQMSYGETNFRLPGDKNLFFEAANRNKKSITLNMKQEKGKEIAHRLAAKCDVFLTNHRTRVIEKVDMSYEKLSELNPMIIYASVSAFGANGPEKDQGGFDPQGQARSGLMYAMGEPHMPPLFLLFGVMDQMTSITTSQAITTALLMRERFGVGQKVDTSLLGSALYIQYINVFNALWLKQNPIRHNRVYTDPMRNYYLCKDDKWICISNPEQWEDRWVSFCQAIGQPELAENPDFGSHGLRFQNNEKLIPILDRAFLARTRDEWIKIFNSYDIISCAVNTTLELEDDPQVMENDYIVDFDDPVMGKIRLPGFPIHFSKAEAGTRRLAPTPGQHTVEILRDIAGYSQEEITQFQQDGVV